MKNRSSSLKMVFRTFCVLGVSTFLVSADGAVPVGEDAVPVGEDAVPVGEDAVPVGEDAVPVGEGAVPVGEGAVPVGEDAVSVGEDAVPVGEGAVPVGEGAVPVGEGAVPAGEGAVPVGEGAVPVDEGAVPVGEGAVPVGEGAVPVGEGAVPVGEGAVPVGEGAVATDQATVRARLANRAAAMKNPDTAHLFAGKPAGGRIAEVEARLAKAIQAPTTLTEASVSERAAQNSAWAEGALASAKSRPADLFTREWWREHADIWTTEGYYITRSPELWWNTHTWSELSRTLGIREGTAPFTYVYDKNLTFKNDVIYVAGQPISSYEDFVESARILAKSTDYKFSPDTIWTPLGTFALSTSLKTKAAPHAVQLAMDDVGNLNGVYANWETGKSLPVQGRVQRDTQRVALQLGRDGTIVVETGLSNLTADIARLWAHLPNQHSQTWLLVRMK